MENKKETLARLYTLRAGMSAISVEKDEIIKLEKSKFIQAVNNDGKILQEKKENNAKEIAEIKKLQDLAKKHPAVNVKVLNALIPIGGIFFWIFGILGGVLLSYKHWFGGLSLFICVLCLIPLIISLPILGPNGEKEGNVARAYKFKSKEDYYLNRLKELESENTSLEHRINEYNNKIAQEEISFNFDKNIKLLKPQTNANKIYNTLTAKYADFLDLRDWESVDLIIYYFETNRAESIKEALIMVDAQKAVGAIVGAINNASREISSTIRAGFAGIRHEIQTGFDGLYKQMYDNANALQNGLKNLTDSIDFANSLQEKANVSSKQLADDIAYIKQRAINKY